MSTETHSTLRTRASLLFRLRDWKDAASWSEFDGLYRSYVFAQALRSGLSRTECDDLVQDVFKRVAETIHEFDARPDRGSFRRWLITLVRWRIADKFRERDRAQWAEAPGADTDTGDATATIDRVPDVNALTEVDATWEAEWQKHLLDAAFERLAKKTKAKQYQAFELFARHHWPVSRISKEIGINLPTVYVINHRLTKQLKAEVDRLRRELG